ncbi:MAG TPA: alpha/beta hydrolase-fold protein [Thermoanaerobaculia bacterium]
MLQTRRAGVRGFDFRHDSPALGRSKTARVILPEAPAPAGGFDVVYFLHAFGGNRLSWPLALDSLLDEPFFRTRIVVAPESGRRWFINDAMGNRYEDYLVEDLMGAVEREFPVAPRHGNAAIFGFSMGGAAAVSLALRHPGLFTAAFSYAGAFHASRRTGDPYAELRDGVCMMPTEDEHNRVWGAPGSAVRRIYDPDTLIRNVQGAAGLPQLFLEVGTEDYPRVLQMNRAMDESLTAAGVRHTYAEHPGAHEWDCAAHAAGRAIRAMQL